jgi:hypothetical protein
MNANQSARGPEQVTVSVGGTLMVVTLHDVEALRDALLDHLRHSDYYARERLMASTAGSVRIDADGKARIGRWRLGSDQRGLLLRLREPPGPEEGKAHRASVAKQGSTWTITGLVLERLRPPSPR